MSIDKGTVSKTLALKERTYLITVSSPVGEDPMICVNRHDASINADGTLNSAVDLPCIEIAASKIAASIARKLTGAELAEELKAWGDFLATAKAERSGPFAPPEPVDEKK